MKTYSNHIKGKDYLYAYDTIFIAKGKSIQKTKSLGLVDSSTDLSVKMSNFAKAISNKEKKMRVDYWSKKIYSPKFSKYVSVEKLETLRSELYRSKGYMGDIGNSAMEAAFLVDFIYNSNKIEGSKIPRSSIEEAIRQGGKVRNDEIGNTLRSVYFIDNDFKMSLAHIKQLHSALLAHEPSKFGLRKERVVVGNSEVVNWKEIKPRLKELLDWYKCANKNWYPPELAFTFYYRFERIHPFIDGNGRAGRLLMNKILKDHKYHPIIIWNKRRQAHNAAFESFDNDRSENYFKFMAEQYAKTYQIYIDKIQKAFDLEKQLDYFLKPSDYYLE